VKITFQVSLYPVGQPDFKKPIDNFIGDLRKDDIHVEVHETSTIGSGEIHEVFDSLQKAYSSAVKSGDTVMVITVVNGAPSKEELKKLNG
jgi:uncharacterized protein YqgV (UPF0045/DUF77 family)